MVTAVQESRAARAGDIEESAAVVFRGLKRRTPATSKP